MPNIHPKLGEYVKYHSGSVGKVTDVYDGGFLVTFSGGSGCNHGHNGVAASVVTDPQEIRIYELEREVSMLHGELRRMREFRTTLCKFINSEPSVKGY